MTMALKNKISRRNFAQRAGLLVSSLGLASTVQAGLLDNIMRKASKKWGGEAMAAGNSTARYRHIVELGFRAGAPFDTLMSSDNYANPAMTNRPNLNYLSSPAATKTYIAAAGVKPVHFPVFTAGQGGDALLSALQTVNAAGEKVGIAYSNHLTLAGGNHTDRFNTRNPNGMISPIIAHGAIAFPADVDSVDFNAQNSGVTTVRGAYAAPALVQDDVQFDGLFRELPMYFSLDEIKVIVGEIEDGSVKPGGLGKGALGKVDDLFLVKNVAGSQSMAQVSLAGRAQAQITKLGLINGTFNTITNPTTGTFGPAATLNRNVGGTILGVALAKAAAAFKNGALNSMVVGMDFNDWHGNNFSGGIDNPASKQGDMNIGLGNALAGFIRALDLLDDPAVPGKKLSETTLIYGSTEFTRGAEINGGDNPDGGRGGFFLIGAGVKSGAYGDADVSTGAFTGFSATTGAPGGSTPEASAWKTVLTLMGAPASMMGGVTQPVLSALLKP
jgi:hypothetical protein